MRGNGDGMMCKGVKGRGHSEDEVFKGWVVRGRTWGCGWDVEGRMG